MQNPRLQSRRASIMCGSDPDLRFKTRYGCSANYFPLIIRKGNTHFLIDQQNPTRATVAIVYRTYFFFVQGHLLMFRDGFPRSFPVVRPLRKRTRDFLLLFYQKQLLLLFLYVDQLK